MSTSTNVTESKRSKLRLNQGWNFHLGDVPEAAQADFDDSAWETVTIPHSLRLTSLNLDGCNDDKTQPTFHRDVGWYRRRFTINPDAGQKVFLEFEGAHQVTDVWVNSRYVGQHAIGGYTPFHFDITDFVHPEEENVVALKVDNRKNPDVPPDPGPFDYIKFSGLYREVYLVQSEKLFITFPWESRQAGIRITTPTVKKHCATVTVETNLRNEHDEPRQCRVLTRIVDADGMVALRMENSAEIPANSEYIFCQTDGIVENLRLWSCDDPYLYRVNTLVFDGEALVDCLENPLGFRSFELRRETGFLLNGQPLKLIGVNRHQHYAYIGDAVPKSLHRKDALQFKQAGFNVVRLAHYPHDNAFLEACDELGILVFEEAPTWIDFGPTEAWNNNLELALRRAIRNHRNHPCIFAWGGGINHRGCFEPLHYSAKEEDPSRWTVSNHAPWTGAQASDICDFYSNMDYRNLPEPEEPMFAAEHGISIDGERAQIMVSRYKANPLRFGMAAWTAHAYYTFHKQTGGNQNRTRGGMMDIFRLPRPVYYWYQSELTDEPMIYIADDWKEGVETIRIFSNCEEVELLVNGTSLGKRKADDDPQKAHLQHPPFSFPVCWQPGEIQAKGWSGGEEKVSCSLRTPETPHGIELTADLEGRDFVADGSDIVQLFARVIDQRGTTIKDYDGKIAFSVEGPADIIGGPEIASNPMECFDGIAPALLRTGLEAGAINIHAEAEGLESGELLLESAPACDDMLAAQSRPIYDLPRARIDLGGKGQHVQYGWLAWNGENWPHASFEFTMRETVTAMLRSAPEESLFWRDESNVPGPLGFMAEDGVCAKDELTLDFLNLTTGRYRIRLYHYAPESDTDNMDPLEGKEYSTDPGNMPPALYLDLGLEDAKSEMRNIAPFVAQGSGSKIGRKGPEHSEFQFQADGEKSVRIRISSSNGEGGVWLNGIDLREIP